MPHTPKTRTTFPLSEGWINVKNNRTKSLHILIEPWGVGGNVAPGQSVFVRLTEDLPVVLRSSGIEQARRLYELFGLTFVKHRHGKGAEHYASENGPVFFEIYPSKDAPLSQMRFGFHVASADETVNRLHEAGATILSAPKDSP